MKYKNRTSRVFRIYIRVCTCMHMRLNSNIYIINCRSIQSTILYVKCRPFIWIYNVSEFLYQSLNKGIELNSVVFKINFYNSFFIVNSNVYLTKNTLHSVCTETFESEI